MKAWWIFTKERFEPVSHLLMIFVFILVHYLLARKLQVIHCENYSLVFLFYAITFFYFKLRLYDEVKDYEIDLIVNKTRPLPRGLLNHRDMYNGMAVCIAFEIIFFSIQHSRAIVSILIAIFYSLLMYKEFFIREKIRPHLTIYAMSHTIVTSLLTFAIFSFLTKESFRIVITNKNFLFFSISNWMLFNIFEFGRKTFEITEERENVDTYSSLFGKKGAALLVLSQVIISIFLLHQLPVFDVSIIHWGLGFLLFLQIIITLQFVISNKAKNAKRYRMMSSVYIILFYIILALGLYF